MRDHDEIRSMLAALAGGDLSKTDQNFVEQHLADCPSCRTELAQLQLVVQAVHAIPEAEPPPWLVTRIMAQVREEAAQQQNWFARLFLPLHLKLPLEAFALVMICVTAWYVMQEVDRSQKVTPDAPNIKAPTEESVRDAVVQPVPVPPSAAPVAPKIQTHPSAQPGTPVAQEPPAPAFTPPPQAAADRTGLMERAKAASEAAPAAPSANPEQTAGSAAPMAERKTAAKRKAERSDNRLDAAVPQPLRLRLVAHDREAFAGKLADILQRLGGSMVNSRPGTVLVRIDAARLSELLSQLALLGRVTEQPVVDANRAGVVELQIFW
jgi:hypothetical protein